MEQVNSAARDNDRMLNVEGVTDMLDICGLNKGTHGLPERIRSAFSSASHGDFPKWASALRSLPDLPVSRIVLNESCIRIDSTEPLEPQKLERLYETLQKLHPWRKGPYRIHGIHIDSEWRSDWKWDRLGTHIRPLDNRRVLDVGCGNGYHCWRMLGAGARLVIGIDPTLLSVMQFQAVRHFVGTAPVFVLPLGVEDFPEEICGFDTVFSMGVLYHRKSPLDHLSELHGFLRSAGELVLETLVVDGPEGYALLPEDRYAMMRNVWFIPSCPTLINWMKRCGFKNVRLVDVTATSVKEQRSTEWMRFHSLAEFLDPNDRTLTREGLPAPKRAIFIAEKS